MRETHEGCPKTTCNYLENFYEILQLKDSVEPVWMDLAYVPHHGASSYANSAGVSTYVSSNVPPPVYVVPEQHSMCLHPCLLYRPTIHCVIKIGLIWTGRALQKHKSSLRSHLILLSILRPDSCQRCYNCDFECNSLANT